jgi:hypothetical protein
MRYRPGRGQQQDEGRFTQRFGNDAQESPALFCTDDVRAGPRQRSVGFGLGQAALVGPLISASRRAQGTGQSTQILSQIAAVKIGGVC